MATLFRRVAAPTPVLYLDIDGTVRKGFDELGRFVNGPDDVEIFPEVPGLLAFYREHGWRIIGVSNQGGIALGHVTPQSVSAAMLKTYDLCDHAFAKIAWCPHHPDADDPEMAVCWCRKPRAGLIVEAANDLARELNRKAGVAEMYPPHLALMVGDRPEDAGCAEAAGIEFMAAEEWRAGRHRDRLLAAMGGAS